MNTDDGAEFEPLSEHEQAMLGRLHIHSEGGWCSRGSDCENSRF